MSVKHKSVTDKSTCKSINNKAPHYHQHHHRSLPNLRGPVAPPPPSHAALACQLGPACPRGPSREAAKTAPLPAVSAFAVVASRCAASRQGPSDSRAVGMPAVSALGSRCAASRQAPPRESSNTAPAAVSKSESTATTIALAVATPVGAQPKAPRRTAPNAHAIAEKSEVTTIATIA